MTAPLASGWSEPPVGACTPAGKRGFVHGAHPVAYIYPCLLMVRGTDEQLNWMAGVSRPAKTFTPKQGQYLAFIHLYTRLHRRPPAEADMQQYFRVSPPSVHQMVLTLEREGFIKRQPRAPRSIELLVDPKLLPELLDPRSNLSKSLCRGTSGAAGAAGWEPTAPVDRALAQQKTRAAPIQRPTPAAKFLSRDSG